MHEGPEAFERFREAAKKLVSTPKDSAPNPFGKGKKKKGSPQGLASFPRFWRFASLSVRAARLQFMILAGYLVPSKPLADHPRRDQLEAV